MVDPFTILGVLGFCIGCVGFATGGLEKAALKFEELRAYELHQNECLHKLQACEIKLTAWVKIWYGDRNSRSEPFPDKVYQYFWSEEGFKNNQRRMETISKLAYEAQKLIAVPKSSPNEKQRKAILNWLRRSEDRMRKAMYKFAQANNILERLSRAITELNEYSTMIYNEPLLETLTEITWDTLKQIESTQKIKEGLNNFAQDVYTYRNHTSEGTSSDYPTTESRRWWLELRTPDQRNTAVAKIGSLYYVDLDFAIRWRESGIGGGLGQKCRRSRIFYRSEEYKIDEVRNLIMCLNVRLSQSDDQDLNQPESRFEVLPSPEYGGRSLKAALALLDCSRSDIGSRSYLPKLELKRAMKRNQRRALSRSIAQIALGLVNWALLLWETPWFQHICSCTIRTILVPSIDSYENHHIFSCIEPHELDHLCHGTNNSFGILFELGIVLGELALLEPLSASIAGSTIVFTTGSSRMHVDELLHLVDNVIESPQYTDAMKSCFRLADHVKPQNLRSEDLSVLCRQIVDPLQKYYDLTMEALARLERSHVRRNLPSRSLEENLAYRIFNIDLA